MSTKEINQFRWTIMVALPAMLFIVIKFFYYLIKPQMLIYTDDSMAIFLLLLPLIIIITALVMAILLVVEYIYCEVSKFDTYQLVKIFIGNQEEIFHKICILPFVTVILFIISMLSYYGYMIKYDNDILNIAAFILMLILIIACVFMYVKGIRNKRKTSKLSTGKLVIFYVSFFIIGMIVLLFIALFNYNLNNIKIAGNLDENGVVEFRINSNNSIKNFELEIENDGDIFKKEFDAEDIICSAALIQNKNNEYTTQKLVNKEYYKKIDLTNNLSFSDNKTYKIVINAIINNRSYRYFVSFIYSEGKFHTISDQKEVEY